MGGGGSTTSTQTNDIPEWARPFAVGALQHSASQYSTPAAGARNDQGYAETGGGLYEPQFYSGRLTAPTSSTTDAAIAGIDRIAAQGNPTLDAANKSMSGIMNGNAYSPMTVAAPTVTSQGVDPNYTWAMAQSSKMALDNPAMQQLYGAASNSISNPAMAGLMAQGSNPYANVGTGYVADALAGNNTAGVTMNQTAGGQMLNSNLGTALSMPMATGAYTGTGPAMTNLSGVASGQAMNPWLDAQFQAAADPVMRMYQTGTAPTIDSQFEAANRFGMPANTMAQSTAAQDYGRTLSGLASNIYGTGYQNAATNQLAANQMQSNEVLQQLQMQQQAANQVSANFSNERGLQTNAAGALMGYGAGLGNTMQGALASAGGLYNTGVSNQTAALNAAGNLYSTGVGQNMTGIQNYGQMTDSAANRNLQAQQANAGYSMTAQQANQQAGMDSYYRNQGNQIAAAGQVGGLTSAALTPYIVQQQAGQYADQYAQSANDRNVNRYMYNADLPYMGQQRYTGLMTGTPGTTLGGNGTSSQPYHDNSGTQLAGAGIAAAGMVGAAVII